MAALSASWMHVEGDALVLDVFISPRATRSRVMGVHDGRLKIQLAASPTDGHGNEALLRFLADRLEVARAQVEIVAGAASHRKRVRIERVDTHRALLALAPSERSA